MDDQANSKRSVAEDLAERVARPVVYRLPDMDRVRVISNLKYSGVDNPDLLMDVYVPPDLEPHARRPVVVFIHGGAGREHRPKDWGIFQSWGRLVAAAGMVAVMFTHRFSPPPQLLLVEAASDLSAALRFVRSNAESFYADGDRVGVCAWSSGRDEIPTLNDALDRFVVKALAANAPITVMNHPTGGHGFDNQGGEERSTPIIRSSIEFMRIHLGLG